MCRARVSEVPRHSLEEAQWFFQNGYRPDNAVIAIVGGFDPVAMENFLRETWGSLKRPSESVVRRESIGPTLATSKRIKIRSSIRSESCEIEWRLPSGGNWAELYAARRVVARALNRANDPNLASSRVYASIHRGWNSFSISLRPNAGAGGCARVLETAMGVLTDFDDDKLVSSSIERVIRELEDNEAGYDSLAYRLADRTIRGEPAAADERESALRSLDPSSVLQWVEMLKARPRIETWSEYEAGSSTELAVQDL